MADRFILNPFTGRLDDTGPSTSDLDTRYVLKTGDTMTGDLTFATTVIGPVLTDGTNTWRITVDSHGNLITSLVGSSTAGTPMGLLLSLTYST